MTTLPAAPPQSGAGPRPEARPQSEARRCTCWPGATVWLTGLPSAGKTTIAEELAGRLRRDHRRVEVLDGDQIRKFLSADLGFSRDDRNTNVQRIGMVCSVRDVKGLYAKQAAGEISGLTGVDDPYEAPEAPDLRIESHTQSVRESASALYALLTERGLA
nr:adenylyl-sulfate kinase [Streptomyces sp. NRRL F-2747]